MSLKNDEPQGYLLRDLSYPPTYTTTVPTVRNLHHRHHTWAVMMTFTGRVGIDADRLVAANPVQVGLVMVSHLLLFYLNSQQEVLSICPCLLDLSVWICLRSSIPFLPSFEKID